MLDPKLYKVTSVKSDCKTFSDRKWKDDTNKNLFRLVVEGRLNIAPCTIYSLDQLNLNRLEILEFNNIIGSKIYKLTPAACDFLNLIEVRESCIFSHEQKLDFAEGKRKYPNIVLNGFCSDFTNGIPLRAVALFNLDSYRLDYYDKKRK